MAILFVHGAGGYREDRAIVDSLSDALDAEVVMPEIADDDMSYTAWSAAIAAHVTDDIDIVVGHSFGGSTALRMAVEGDLAVSRLVLLAAPDWGPNGWDVAEYALPDDAAGRLGDIAIELHHCADDEIVPPGHLDLLAARLPQVAVVRHADGGHQFEGESRARLVRAVAAR